MIESSLKYKFSYTIIFALNYFSQGIITSIFSIVIPFYLLVHFGKINQASIAFMSAIILIPSFLKFFFAVLTDKTRSKRFGRRKPWIVGPLIITSIIWIYTSFVTLADVNKAIIFFTIIGFFIFLGILISDTAVDGFLLDICPSSRLGKTQGMCWAFRSGGIIIGGPIIIMVLSIFPFQLVVFVIGIIMIFFSISIFYVPTTNIFQEVRIISNLKLILKKDWKENSKVFLYSFFAQIVGGVVYTFLSIYILIKLGYVNSSGRTVNMFNTNLYYIQMIITSLITIGIIVGAIIGGYVADKKSRRLSVFLSIALNAIFLMLVLFPFSIFILFIIITGVGFASGFIFSSYSAVIAEYSKQYSETSTTYYSICVSCINAGTVIGLAITGVIFNLMVNITSDALFVYCVLFVFMIVLESIALIPFLKMNRKIYECKKI